MIAQGTPFEAPTLEWATLLPVIIVLGTATLSVLVSAFLPRSARWTTQVAMSLLGLIGGLVALAFQWSAIAASQAPVILVEKASNQPLGALPFVVEPLTVFLQGIIVILALISVLVMAERSRSDEVFAPAASAIPGSDYEKQARKAGLTMSESFSLVLFAVGGMMAFVSAADLLTMFVALEVFSLPLYILTGLAARRRLISQEASLKYFILGAFSSAIFLFGIAFVFAMFGTINLVELGDVTARPAGATSAIWVAPGDTVAVIVWLLVLVGLLFKVGAAPFHSWTPDVYEGAPTPVTGFMAACTKIAAFGALLRVMSFSTGFRDTTGTVIATVAALSMVVGVTVALRQSNVKRMMAYSSIAHAGFILAAMTQFSRATMESVSLYLMVYGVTTVGTFAVIALVRERTSAGGFAGEAVELSDWKGLGQRSPLLAATFTILMLATAGIPLTSGFVGKFAVFKAAIEHDALWLAVLGVVMSAVAAYLYLRIVVTMWTPTQAPKAISISSARPLTTAVVTLCVLVTMGLGIYPSPAMELLEKTSNVPWAMQQQR